MNLSGVHVPSTCLRAGPDESADIETEVLYGERVLIESTMGEWAQVRTILDDYPGYVRTADLLTAPLEPTHRVSEVMVPVYSRPSFKCPDQRRQLYMNSLVHVFEEFETPEGRMAGTDVGWIFCDQLRALDQFATDYVDVCLQWLGCAYEWGARSRAVIDCSALLQAGCIAAGIPCPRNVGQQAQVLGEPLDYAPDFSDLVRGDLVFWTGGRKGRHVAIMLDGRNSVHASIVEPHRRVLEQPLADVISDQVIYENGPVTAVRRLVR